MAKKILTIETNEDMEVTSFFGFTPSEEAEERFAYVAQTAEGIELYLNGQLAVTIEWFNHFYGKNATENEIWYYILHECRKHTRARKIYIDKFYVDVVYEPLALIYDQI